MRITRRMYASMLAATLAMTLHGATAQAAAPGDDALSAEVFGALSSIGHPTISPDGTRLAYLTHIEGDSYLAIISLVGDVGVRHNTSRIKTRALRWASDDIVLLMATSTERRGYHGDYEASRIFAVGVTGDSGFRQIPSNGPLVGVNVNLGSIAGIDWRRSYAMMPIYSDEGKLNLLAVDTTSGRTYLVGEGEDDTRSWVVNANGQPILRLDFDDQRNRLRVHHRIGNNWQMLVESRTEIPNINPLGRTSTEGELAVGLRFSSPGMSGIYAMSTENGDITRALVIDPRYDIESSIIDPYTNRVLGAHIQTTIPSTIWIDPFFKEQQALLDASFPDQFVRILSWSRDRSRLIISAENGASAPMHYLFNTADRTAQSVGAAYPRLYNANLPTRESISYTARDGETIPAYLTLPADREAQNLPLVVLAHGGPESRDHGGFDWLAHFLSSRGYIVLQPNFRGSEGYGLAWRNAGRGGWGTGVMQHDLSDGVTALVEAGMADPERVCIVGASYGGYAALAGATFTPELYACAAAIAPVTNVGGFISHKRAVVGRNHWVIEYWDRVLGGDENARRQRLREISPALHADNVRAPILLLHGRDDTVVDISQSNQMERALRRAGADVHLVRLRGEDHWLSTAETRTRVLTELEAFLAEHLD